jgi:hypothetical protein
MTVTAAPAGRNLSITVEGIPEPFIIAPLPGFAGERATDMFLKIAARQVAPESLVEVWQLAVDGVDTDGNVVLDGPNWTRINRTLSLTEGEAVIHPAFYWQTTLGMDGVNAFIDGGGGLAGGKKALELLIWTLGISPMQTGRSTALEHLIQSPGLTPLTPANTTTVDKLPPHKRGFMQTRRERRKKA